MPQDLLITVVDSKIPIMAYSQNIDGRNRRYNFYFLWVYLEMMKSGKSGD